MKHPLFDASYLTRLGNLKKSLDSSESKLRTLRGKHLNRIHRVMLSENQAKTIPDELLKILAQDLEPASRKALLELEDKLRSQAISYFKQSKVDPKLWIDLASS